MPKASQPREFKESFKFHDLPNKDGTHTRKTIGEIKRERTGYHVRDENPGSRTLSAASQTQLREAVSKPWVQSIRVQSDSSSSPNRSAKAKTNSTSFQDHYNSGRAGSRLSIDNLGRRAVMIDQGSWDFSKEPKVSLGEKIARKLLSPGAAQQTKISDTGKDSFFREAYERRQQGSQNTKLNEEVKRRGMSK